MMPPPNQKTCQEGLIDQLSRLLREDDRVLAAWLVGSLAQGSGDRFSDIDLYIVPGDLYYEAVFEERENLAQSLGDVLSTFEVSWPSCQMLGVILKNGVELDLCYSRLDQCEIFKSDCSYKILFDKSGQLEQRLSTPVLPDDDPIEEIQHIIRSSHYHFLHAIHGMARENLWSALYHTERLRTGYIQLLSRRAGRDLQEWKALELHDGTELSALKETFCSFNRESVRRGIDTLVELFRSELALLSQKYHVRFAPEQMTHWKGYMQDALRWE